MGKILVRGSINIDEFFNVPHIVNSGETISSTGYSKRAGGKGANQAVSAAKAGATVDFAGHIGQDGVWLKDVLKGYGVGLDYLGLDDELPTGRALIQLSSSTSDNSIVLLPGSNFSTAPLAPTFSSYTHLLLQNEIPFSSTVSSLRLAKQNSVTTIFNPSPLPSEEQLKEIDWNDVDWLLVNEGEGLALAGLKEGESEEKILGKLTSLSEKGGLNAIMTKGADGVVAVTKEGATVSCPAGKVNGGVKDTTGAGDCFTGYFATLLSTSASNLDSNNLFKILQTASQASAICVESEGAMESVPLMEQVRERLGA
ncbi:Ribokinase-like protein [Meredithblackwellia eburnea MCA 4105]